MLEYIGYGVLVAFCVFIIIGSLAPIWCDLDHEACKPEGDRDE
jgi:hypothetical protein